MILRIFGEVERRNQYWDGRLASPVITAFGNTELDFRYAELGEGETEVVILSLFGNVNVTVPDDLPTIAGGMTVLGNRTTFGESSGGVAHGTDAATSDYAGATGRRLRLSIFAALGNVEVRRATPVAMSV